jgi:hypothetical protein
MAAHRFQGYSSHDLATLDLSLPGGVSLLTVMKFNAKQIEDMARLMGTLAAAAAAAAVSGASVGWARPEQISRVETVMLAVVFVTLLICMIVLRKE